MRLSPLYVVASFAVGMIFVIFTVPLPKVVVKFPHPEVSKNEVFKGAHGQCYSVDPEEVRCAKDAKAVKSQPLQAEYADDSNNAPRWKFAAPALS